MESVGRARFLWGHDEDGPGRVLEDAGRRGPGTASLYVGVFDLKAP